MKSIYERYEDITGIDIDNYFYDYQQFISNDYPRIVSYYIDGVELSMEVVNNLENLYKTAKEIIKSFETYKNKLSQYWDFWELLELCEKSINKLETFFNSKRWFRSNKSLYYDNKFEQEYILKQGQTLSNLAQNVGYSNPNDDWVNIALKNTLNEDDYNVEGGAILKITFRNQVTTTVTGFIGENSGSSVYGKDIYRQLTLEEDDTISDAYDFKVLNEEDTIVQSYDILINTFKGSVPEFPNRGIEKGLIGSNRNNFRYPTLLRQLSEVISTDDSFTEFNVNDISLYADGIDMELVTKTKLSSVFKQTLEL